MIQLGDFPTSGKVFVLWNTNDQTGASITRSTDGTLKIFKGNLTAATWITERSSLAGVTQTEDFDGATGVHGIAIDLADNTDAGFYAAGNEYQVVMTGMTIDTKTVNATIAHFSIERTGGALALIKAIIAGTSFAQVDVAKWLGTAVATPTVAGVPEVDLTHLGGVAQSATDLKDFADDGYDPATNKVQGVVLVDTLTTYTGNTPQTGDAFARIGVAGAGLTAIDLPDQTMNITGNITGNLSGSVGSVTGAVGSVTGAVGSVTGAVGSVTGLTAATVHADLDDIQARLPAALVAGRIDASVGAMAADVVTAAAIATNAIDADALAADVATELQAGLATAASIAALNNLSAAQVNAEVVDALNVDTYAEPGQEAPPATTTIVKKIGYTYKAWRNRGTQTATTYSLYGDDATTVHQKATVSDDAVTFDKGEVATGP